MYLEELFVRVEWLSLSMILNFFFKFPKSGPRDFYKLNLYKKNCSIWYRFKCYWTSETKFDNLTNIVNIRFSNIFFFLIGSLKNLVWLKYCATKETSPGCFTDILDHFLAKISQANRDLKLNERRLIEGLTCIAWFDITDWVYIESRLFLSRFTFWFVNRYFISWRI